MIGMGRMRRITSRIAFRKMWDWRSSLRCAPCLPAVRPSRTKSKKLALEASRYAYGNPTDNPDILVYHLCRTFGCLPSDLDEEDMGMMERLAYINYVHESKIAAEMRAARDRSK